MAAVPQSSLIMIRCILPISGFPQPITHAFAPDLVEAIAKTSGKEVGSHTFSHYYTNEPGQTESQFRADLQAAKKIAGDKFGLELVSLVFPRNQLNPSYLPICKAEGFDFVRSNPVDWYLPKSGGRLAGNPLRNLAEACLPHSRQPGKGGQTYLLPPGPTAPHNR